MPKNQAGLASWLTDLGNRFEMRFDQLSCPGDLEEAIKVTRQVIKVTPTDSISPKFTVYSIADKLHKRLSFQGRLEDLDEAIKISRCATKARPVDS
ncbi:hypothetical protein LTR17_022902, partial [Elasticomyces elasticus]